MWGLMGVGCQATTGSFVYLSVLHYHADSYQHIYVCRHTQRKRQRERERDRKRERLQFAFEARAMAEHWPYFFSPPF
jgi:hypothetical protein